MKFLGAPYPITRHPRGFLRTQEGINQVKSDLLILLLTNPGERVMLPNFGTPLAELVFEPNDSTLALQAREMISNAIRTWEHRIAIEEIEVTTSADIPKGSLNPEDTGENLEHVLFIRILFSEFDDIQEIQELHLQVPLAGG